jgi:hypothetical protein
MATFGTDVKPAVQRNTGNRTDSDTAAIVLTAYNTSLNLISRTVDWPEAQVTTTKTLTSAKYMYSINTGITEHFDISDLRKWYKIQLYDGTRFYPPLKKVVWNEFRNKYLANIHTSSGKPEFWAEWAGTMYLYPAPNAAYVLHIDYYKKLTLGTADATVFPLSDDMLSVVIACTTAFTWLALEETQLMTTWFGIASQLLKPFGVELKDIIDFETSRDTDSGTSSTPWIDPFARRS